MSYQEISSTASVPKAGGDRNASEIAPLYDPDRHIAPVVAHELNNILTIVQGYADRLLIRHGTDPALVPQLRLIADASKRAAAVVRRATPQRANHDLFSTSSSTPAPVAVAA